MPPARFPCRSILLEGSGSACLLAAQLSLPCAPDVCPSVAPPACKDSTLHLGFAAASDADMHRYNLPQQVELAAVWDTSDGSFPQQRDLVVWPRDPATPVLRVAERNEHVDQLTLALLFPTGVPGWHDLLRHPKDFLTPKYQWLTPAQFYTLRLMVRSRDAVLPHGAGMLFQQYILDAFCRMEASRMSWLRQNEDKLRSETMVGLQEFLTTPGEQAALCGKPVILPASYPGSPRSLFQFQHYLDAIAVVRRSGRPDYFITFTANPT